jgi:hypothetical protein
MRRLDSATPLRCARNDPVNENRVACSQPWLFAQTQQRFPVNACYLFRTAVRLRGNDRGKVARRPKRRGFHPGGIKTMSMIVPDFWAEGRAQARKGGKQVTVWRFGWSDASQDEAQQMADQRAQEALARKLDGDRVNWREPKVPYNGAQGMPIREQVVSRHGDEVITRNSYGALCLNTPGVLFADVDLESTPLRSWKVEMYLLLGVAALLCSWFFYRISSAILAGGLLLSWAILTRAVHRLRRFLQRRREAREGGLAAIALRRVKDFAAAHPDWGLRVYQTPAGLRLMATHRRFDPGEPAVAEFFDAVQADPLYVTMCKNQQCFRARLSAKPWRIGMRDRLRPRPGIWPVNPERLPERNAWLTLYDARASTFAACRFERALGNPAVAPDVAAVIDLHDSTARALQAELALA